MHSAAVPIPKTQRAGVLLAGLVACIATLAVLGWVFGVPSLVRVLPGYPPVYFNSAVGMLGAALGLYGIAGRHPPMVPAGIATALLIGGATLFQYVAGIDLPIDTLVFAGRLPGLSTAIPGRMPAVSALSLTLAGVALLALHRPRWHPMGHVVAGTLGAIIAALAMTVLLAYATGVLSELRSGAIAGLPIPACMAYAMLGLGLMVVSWRRDATVAMLPEWLPYGVGIAMLITTVVVWRALNATEQAQSEARLRILAEVARRTVAADLDGVIRLLRGRSASAIELGGRDPGDRYWVETTRLIGADLPGFRAILWLDSTHSLRAAARAEPGLQAGTALAEEQVRLGASNWPGSIVPGGAQSRFTRDDRGRPLLAVMVPNCGARGCAGFTAGLLETNAFLGDGLDGVTPGYVVEVRVLNQLLYPAADSLPARVAWTGTSSFEKAGLRWTVQVWPTSVSAATFHSDLPAVVAGLGTAVSVLIAMSLRLLQNTHAMARATERARLARGVESATDGLWERDLKSGESTRSAAVWRRLGYDPDEAARRGSAVSWETLLHPEDREAYDATLQSHLTGATEAFELEYRVQARAGGWHWIVDRGRVIERDEWNRPVRMLGLCADVTERKRSEKALSASERRFRTMFDSAVQLQHLVDLDCNLLEANRTSLGFAGVSIEDVRGKPLWETPWWTGAELRQARLRKACEEARRGRTVRYEEEIRGTQGRASLMDFSLTPILDDEGRVVQLLAEGRDITELQRAETAMRELDTLSTMGRLAARVAHEINNPLAGIQNSFLLIKGAIPATHPYFAYVGAIEREITRMAAITRQLYETYRPDNDTRVEASVPILISDAVTMLEQVNRAAQVKIEVDTTGSPPVLPLPGALLRQAVYNLVQNAVEASPPGGTVRVRAWRTDGTFWLSVADEGPGVPADIRSRIFEPFVTTKSGLRTGGMGLGLSLVKRSVQALGGRIELRDPEGGGSEFLIAIPLSVTRPGGV